MIQMSLEDSLNARDEALEQVAAGSFPPLNGLLLDCIYAVAGSHDTFTTDDVWLEASRRALPAPDEPRVMGALMMQAKREGWIAATGEHRTSKRPVHHAFPCRCGGASSDDR